MEDGAASAVNGKRMHMKTQWPWVPTLAAVLLIPVFLALGYWQLQRAEEKRVLQAEYDRRAMGPPARLGIESLSAQALRFRPVVASGRYRPEQQVLIDNRVHKGVPGYHVVTPLAVEPGGGYVLVNRGWIALGADRQQLPAIDTPTDVVTVNGVATVPHDDGFRLGAPDAPNAPVWQQLDLERFAARLGAPLAPVVILLDPRSDAGGFVRDWTRLDAGIAVHQGYAFQWFALAAAALVLYGAFVRRMLKHKSHPSSL